MAEVLPLRALHYDLNAVGSLDAVAAPPYDVIDAPMRAELASRSPFNVVEVDLPDDGKGGDPYLHAQELFEMWRQQNVVVRDRVDALWAMTQEYTVPGADRRVIRRGFFARVRVEDYGAGRIRPHERTQPGPKEDRLRLTRATRANLSPIFSLFPDPGNAAWSALEPHTTGEPFGTVNEGDTVNRLWRVAEADAIAAVQAATADAELLIADGHHRYETARTYAEEVGGEGEHRYVLMFLCSLQDPGLTVLPTHRLLTDLKDPAVQERLGAGIKAAFDIEPIDESELEPAADAGGVQLGYMDAHHQQGYRLTLKDQSVADQAMPDMPEPYRRLDTAVLEAVILRGVLGMTVDDVAAKRGLGYSKSFGDALDSVKSGRADAAFFMRGTPIEQVVEVAEAGESMPPKSTYFFPKIPTGLVFSALD
jgi:uncharacterized protein (DUF1015 family)